jgi:cytochrome c oxidase subunit III
LQEVVALEVQSGLIFIAIAAVVLISTAGIGITLGLLAYQADRQVRMTQVRAAEVAAEGGVPIRPPLVPLPASPTTQLLISQGHVEVAPALGLNNNKFGMWIFLASEIMFFTALIAVFATFKFRGFITDNGLLRSGLWLVIVNTSLLLTSSLMVVLALDANQRGDRKWFFNFMVATAVLGATFVGLQGVEWTTLMREGITANSTLFGTSFYVTTGFHGAHVIIGVVWLFSIIARTKLRGEFTPQTNLGYELFGLYWHFVDIVWIILFTVIYLL